MQFINNCALTEFLYALMQFIPKLQQMSTISRLNQSCQLLRTTELNEPTLLLFTITHQSGCIQLCAHSMCMYIETSQQVQAVCPCWLVAQWTMLVWGGGGLFGVLLVGQEAVRHWLFTHQCWLMPSKTETYTKSSSYSQFFALSPE